ncbi:YwmB family TATA-box binding protein [Oceanobacillus salinisoli]|uniref:YwmB family TATA-box binding protein n=1 Tax=Oceanobacillus salinisoli TaxID=2678611 RepID=UPI0012E11974|nr:YwmB family TATA-box binding protein [Oceanobacillus salinisoli]
MWRVLFIAVLLVFTANATVESKGMSELEEMADFVTNQNLTINEWNVVIKEKKEQDEIQEIINELKNSYKGTRTEDENVIKFQFRDTHKRYDFSVLYNVVLPKDNLSYPELTVVIEGGQWNNEIRSEFYHVHYSVTNEFFTESKRLFTWLNTEPSGIIVKAEFEQELTNYFNLQHKKTQLDNASNSVNNKYIYGYTSKWNEKINIEDTPINVQIAITNHENGLPELTLGTPILIHEY